MLLNRTVALGWLVRTPRSRTLALTPAGKRGFAATFRCEPVWEVAERADAGLANGAETCGNDFRASANVGRQAIPSSA